MQSLQRFGPKQSVRIGNNPNENGSSLQENEPTIL
jgi:hypothetical protein